MVRRPALVVARHDAGPVGMMLWALMITNALRAPWPGDIVIPDAETLGLRIPSKVRIAKISTVEETAATAIGRLDDATWLRVQAGLAAAFDPA